MSSSWFVDEACTVVAEAMIDQSQRGAAKADNGGNFVQVQELLNSSSLDPRATRESHSDLCCQHDVAISKSTVAQRQASQD